MASDIHQNPLLILDFGSQLTQLIARCVREVGVYCEIHPCQTDIKRIKASNPVGIILSGGPDSVTASGAPKPPDGLFDLGIPMLGICYGMQLIAHHFNGKVERAAVHEYGYAEVRMHAHSPLFTGIQDRQNAQGHGLIDVWMSHGDTLRALPSGFDRIASTAACPIAGIGDQNKRMYGVQFHPEVEHTPQGRSILRRFVVDICGGCQTWTTPNIISSTLTTLRAQVGEEGKVLLALSGGVDSTVTALLLQQAIGDRLQCVFIDNGLLRLNEGDQIMEQLANRLKLRIQRVNAEDAFLNALAGVEDPEVKRRVIGHQFIRSFEQIAREHTGIRWLAQGTIYPDVIESARGQHSKAQTIKSHHNVGGLPEAMPFELLEPLRDLFKDEVRNIGLELGLDRELVQRHPFPGPGLAVRIMGAVKKEYIDIVRRCDEIYVNLLKRGGWYEKLAQAFVVFVPIKSVGVVGDARRYGFVVAIRAVQTTDFMTADWAPLPPELLATVSNRIVNEVPQVARVVYDISSKPPATIEWE